MNVKLNPQIERYINEQVKAGSFSSPDEVLEAGIARLMLDPQPDTLDAEDLADIEASEKQIARGEDLDWRAVRADLARKYLHR